MGADVARSPCACYPPASNRRACAAAAPITLVRRIDRHGRRRRRSRSHRHRCRQRRRRRPAAGRRHRPICEGSLVRESERAGRLSSGRASRRSTSSSTSASQSVGQDVHEVALKIEVERQGRAGHRLPASSCSMRACSRSRNVPEEQLQPFLLAEAPRLLFPFARKIIADAIQRRRLPAAAARSDRFRRPLHAERRAAAGRGRPAARSGT